MRNGAGKQHSAFRRVLALAAAAALLCAGLGAAGPPEPAETPLPTETAPAPAEPPPETAETPEPEPSETPEPAETAETPEPAGTPEPDAPSGEPEPDADMPPLYDGGRIYIYNAEQLYRVGGGTPVTDGDRDAAAVGTGQPVTDENGEPVTYAPEGVYVLAGDIPLPPERPWLLPESFTGTFEDGRPAEDRPEGEDPPPVYDGETDSVILYNPRQLEAAWDETGEVPVTDTDYDPGTFGTGQPFFPDGEEGGPLTYGPALTYILSAAFAVPEEEAPPETPAGEAPVSPAETEPSAEPEEEPPEPSPEPEADPPAETEPPAEDTATITIRSVWRDWNDAVGVRPASAAVTVYRTLVDENGEAVDETGAPAAEAVTEAVPADELLPANPVVLTAEDRTENALWQTVIEDLPAAVTDEAGQTLAYYAYSVEEDAIDGYSTTLDSFSGERDEPGGATSYEYVFTLTASASPMLTAATETISELPSTGGLGGAAVVCFGAGLTLFGFGLRRRDGAGPEDGGDEWEDDRL